MCPINDCQIQRSKGFGPTNLPWDWAYQDCSNPLIQLVFMLGAPTFNRAARSGVHFTPPRTRRHSEEQGVCCLTTACQTCLPFSSCFLPPSNCAKAATDKKSDLTLPPSRPGTALEKVCEFRPLQRHTSFASLPGTYYSDSFFSKTNSKFTTCFSGNSNLFRFVFYEGYVSEYVH